MSKVTCNTKLSTKIFRFTAFFSLLSFHKDGSDRFCFNRVILIAYMHIYNIYLEKFSRIIHNLGEIRCNEKFPEVLEQ